MDCRRKEPRAGWASKSLRLGRVGLDGEPGIACGPLVRLTDVKLSRPYANLLFLPTLVMPIKVGPMFNGGGFVEAEVLGPDGKQVSAVSCASSGGPLDLFGYYSRSRHARQAMQRAAWELRETLER